MSTPSSVENLASQLNLSIQTEPMSLESYSASADAIAPVISIAESKGVLTLRGEQRITFLQGQSCCDSNVLDKQEATFGAFCNLKGRVISNFFAINDDSECHLIMDRVIVPKLKEHLQKYAVFSRVELIDNSETLTVLCLCAAKKAEMTEEASNVTFTSASTAGLLSATSDNLTLGFYLVKQESLLNDVQQLIIPSLPANHYWASESVLDQFFIMSQIAWISEATFELLLPQLIGLEVLNGLSFSKGCYTGQEIIARMKYRGQLKRSMQLVQIEGANELTLGSTFNSESKKNIGHIINAVKAGTDKQLALVSIEIEQQNIQNVLINDQRSAVTFL